MREKDGASLTLALNQGGFMRRLACSVFLFSALLLSFVLTTAADAKSLAELPSAQPSSEVEFLLRISDCACMKYSSFLLLWETNSGATVDLPDLIGLLKDADTQGLLLCDCRHSDGERYSSVIGEIEQLPEGTGPGLNIILTRTVYLTWDDISVNLQEVLNANDWVTTAKTVTVRK